MATPTAAQLQSQYGIPGIVSITEGGGGLTLLTVTTPAAQAQIYTHGAHVTHYQPAGMNPVLWMSGKSLYAVGKAIRGGVPLIFPWFGPKADNPQAPMHGFVRTGEWALEAVEQQGDEILVTFGFAATDATQVIWPHAFQLRYEVRVGSTLEISLVVTNTSLTPFDFEEALHSYFAVSDVRQVKVTGLEGTTYVDKTDGLKEKPQGDSPVMISAETDRVYLNTRSTCVIEDAGAGRWIAVEKQYSDATVVWNPWIAKSKAMADFGDDEWPGMLCVETVNAGLNRVKLAAGASHAMTARIRSSTL